MDRANEAAGTTQSERWVRVSASVFLRMRGRSARWALLGIVGLVAGCATFAPPAPDFNAIVAAPDRTEADRQTDQRRKPALLYAFTGVRSGMKVLDMGAGGGYSTELLARAVGPQGVVYAQNTPAIVEKMKVRFAARLKAAKNIVVAPRDFDDPVPSGIGNLDLITFFFAYHDVAFMPVDRAKMNRRMYEALKPGGALVIADHSARTGDGTSVARTLHRIEENVVTQELQAAGFRLVDQGNFLRNPADPRTAIVFRSSIPVDEFVLKFEKPG